MVDTTLKVISADGFIQRDGIWYSSAIAPVAFPEEGYDTCFSLEDDSLWFRHRNQCIVQMVQQYGEPRSVFFDIGGGNGYVSLALQEAGYDTYLVEPGERGAMNARSRGVRNVICASVEDLTLPPGAIPALGLFDVLEHIGNDKGFLERVGGFLAPGGILCITVPAYQFLWSPEDDYSGHFRRYSITSLERLVEKAGYRVKYRTCLFSFLPPAIFLLRTLPGRLFPTRWRTPLEKKNFRQDHAPCWKGGEALWRIIARWESSMVAEKRRIPFGSSCLMVAQKI